MKPSATGVSWQHSVPVTVEVQQDVACGFAVDDGANAKEMSLSTFFPKGTEYFYSYPLGEDSHFFNNGHLFADEVIAARAIICAGPDTKVIAFPATIESAIWSVYEKLRLPFVRSTIIPLTAHAQHGLSAREKNEAVKAALLRIVTPGKLVMAQPFLDPALRHLYQIPPDVIVWLNDKLNLPRYIPASFLARRYACFPDGSSFAAHNGTMPLPCVMKVSSSASGDGVRLCRTTADFASAQTEYAALSSTIIVEECLDVARSFSIQFGIPFNGEADSEIIGISEQLTTPEGEFVGGIIDPTMLFSTLDGLNQLLLGDVLPMVRRMGWYGVGGFDVLLARSGKFYIVDPNFRMTAMTPYLCGIRNGTIGRSLVSFNGTGDAQTIIRNILPLAREGDPHQLVHIIALGKQGKRLRMSAAMFFDDEKSMKSTALQLIESGIESAALRILSTFEKKPLRFLS